MQAQSLNSIGLKAIGFDADDTLWDNERLYTDNKERFLDFLGECADRERCRQRLDSIETGNVKYYGYGIKSFVLSMIEAALDLSEGQVAAEKISQILGFARQMLAAEVKLFDGVGETLAALSQQYPLLLITKGDPSEQKRKIDDSGLSAFFRWVEIVHDKTPETYHAILDRYGIKPSCFLMVGNSLRSDILPVLKIGGKAVLIPFANTWAHEMEVDSGEMEYARLEKLAELPEFIHQLNMK